MGYICSPAASRSYSVPTAATVLPAPHITTAISANKRAEGYHASGSHHILCHSQPDIKHSIAKSFHRIHTQQPFLPSITIVHDRHLVMHKRNLWRSFSGQDHELRLPCLRFHTVDSSYIDHHPPTTERTFAVGSVTLPPIIIPYCQGEAKIAVSTLIPRVRNSSSILGSSEISLFCISSIRCFQKSNSLLDFTVSGVSKFIRS